MRLILSALVLSLASSPLAAQNTVVEGATTITLPDTTGYSRGARAILALERQRSAAIARHDTTWLARLYSPDFQGIAGNGARVDRALMFRVFSRDLPESRFLIDELAIRDFGATATVTGRLRMPNPAGEIVAETRYIHVYVRRLGGWQIVSAQGTPVGR